MRRMIAITSIAVVWVWPACALALDQAVVQIGPQPRDDRAAEPPVTPDPAASARAPTYDAFSDFDDDSRSVLRLQLGPQFATTGRGLGPGLGVAADFGHGTVGFRLAAAWLRGESSAQGPSSIGGGLSQYTGELTLDFAKRGPLHPVLGIGFGYAQVDTGQGPGSDGGLGIGTARAGLEYALAFDDADIRFSAGALGALPGPTDPAVSSVNGWVLLGASIGIGF